MGKGGERTREERIKGKGKKGQRKGNSLVLLIRPAIIDADEPALLRNMRVIRRSLQGNKSAPATKHTEVRTPVISLAILWALTSRSLKSAALRSSGVV